MSLERVYAVFARQLFLIKSNPTRLASIFIWILFDIIQWGFISRYVETFGHSTFNFITVILGAIVLWDFSIRVEQGIMTGFLEDIWSHNLINFFASPLEIREYIAGLVGNGIITSMVGFLGMAALAGLAFGYNVFKIGLLIVPFMLVLFIFGIALGVFVAALIFRLGPSAEWLGWPIPFILSIFSCVYYPLGTLPGWLQIIARMLPASYVFEGIRGILAGASSGALELNLLAGASLSLFYLYLTYRFFIHVFRYNLRSGGISRFGAEEI